jgi:hypothetical protein
LMVGIKTLLKLNANGRDYLVNNKACQEKGVDLLSRVSDDLNCLFLHLSENPSLCELSCDVDRARSSDICLKNSK